LTPAAHQIVAGRSTGEKRKATSGTRTAGRRPNSRSRRRRKARPRPAKSTTISVAGIVKSSGSIRALIQHRRVLAGIRWPLYGVTRYAGVRSWSSASCMK